MEGFNMAEEGSNSYEFIPGRDIIDFDVKDQNGISIFHIKWRGIKTPDTSLMDPLKFAKDLTSPHNGINDLNSVSVHITNGKNNIEIYNDSNNSENMGWVITSNKNILSLRDATTNEVLREANEHITSFFSGLAEKNATSAPTDSDDEGPSTEDRTMNAVCYVAGVGTGFWPIGTLIFGPTAVGCVVWYVTGGSKGGRREPLPMPLGPE
jgi:hypothetical protein